MGDQTRNIDSSYENFYAQRKRVKVYPTEFVVRTFLANYPGLKFKRPTAGDRILDVAFGDGRNTTFLCDQGFAVSGIEITQGIVDQTHERLESLGQSADLRVGRNSKIPFDSEFFDYILACHCCYYCDENESLSDNLAEYARVLKRGGYLVASVACKSSYIFKGALSCQMDRLLLIPTRMETVMATGCMLFPRHGKSKNISLHFFQIFHLVSLTTTTTISRSVSSGSFAKRVEL